jgi:phenylacetate-CoA ligase
MIEGAFRCPVVDNYNSREVWTIAFQCRLGHLHVNDDCVQIEIVDDRGVPVESCGTAGRLVVTGLHSYAMPLVRYALGDRVQYEECVCPWAPDSPAIRFAISAAEELIAGTTISGAEVFSKVSRYLYGAFAFQYKEIRVVQVDPTNFDVWVGDLRGDPEGFREQFQQVTSLLLAPNEVHVRLRSVPSEASFFQQHPRSLFISRNLWQPDSVYA